MQLFTVSFENVFVAFRCRFLLVFSVRMLVFFPLDCVDVYDDDDDTVLLFSFLLFSLLWMLLMLTLML